MWSMKSVLLIVNLFAIASCSRIGCVEQCLWPRKDAFAFRKTLRHLGSVNKLENEMARNIRKAVLFGIGLKEKEEEKKAAMIKMFSPYGKIVAEDFLWHTRGPKRGEPRGYAFIQFGTKEEAVLAKEKMHGRLVCGRPLVVRLASEKYLMEGAENPFGAGGETSKSNFLAGSSAQMSKSAKIAAIKNKLKSMEEESQTSKRQKMADKLADS